MSPTIMTEWRNGVPSIRICQDGASVGLDLRSLHSILFDNEGWFYSRSSSPQMPWYFFWSDAGESVRFENPLYDRPIVVDPRELFTVRFLW